MIFWSTEGNIMSTSPSISKSTKSCREWNFVQNMILYSTENPFFEMVFSNMVGWVGELKYEIFSQDFIKLQKYILSFSKMHFSTWSSQIWWVGGGSKISTFFKRRGALGVRGGAKRL